MPDSSDLADDRNGRPDPEDQGQKAFNYSAEPVGPPRWLDMADPATPVFEVLGGVTVLCRLVVGADKPRNHSFTVHGHTWVATHVAKVGRRVWGVSAVSTGWAETLELVPPDLPPVDPAGDYAYRSGVLRSAVSEGLWGILRRVVAKRRRESDEPS